jgi:hypothetical protein
LPSHGFSVLVEDFMGHFDKRWIDVMMFISYNVADIACPQTKHMPQK